MMTRLGQWIVEAAEMEGEDPRRYAERCVAIWESIARIDQYLDEGYEAVYGPILARVARP